MLSWANCQRLLSPAGSLPGCLGQLENLEVLHLAGNQLTGRFASALPGFHLMDHPLQKPCTQNEQCSHFRQSCGLANVTIQAAAGVMYTRCCSAAMPYCLPVWPAASCHDIPRSHGCLVSLENGYSTGRHDGILPRQIHGRQQQLLGRPARGLRQQPCPEDLGPEQ